jgi:hypothetical protein
MDEQFRSPSGPIARIVGDPIRLRRWSWLALLVAIGLVAAGQFFAGLAGGMMTAIAWIIAPIIALGIGVGDAFFIRHGRGRRRITLTILAAVCVALTSCAILAGISDASGTRAQELVVMALSVLLYGGIVVGLAGLIAFGIGRGEDYVSRRIDRMSHEDW